MPEYPLESSAREFSRLELQGQMYSWITKEFFKKSLDGLTPKRILDVGCGVGRVSQELLKVFGDSVEIVAIDANPSVIQYSANKFSDLAIRNVRFACGDWFQEACSGRYDLIVGRLILMYSSNPFDCLQMLCRSVSPGTAVLFQEADHRQHMRTTPTSEVFMQYALALENAAKARGVHVSLGLQLEHLMRKAGLQIACTHRAGRVDCGADSEIYELFSSTIASMRGAQPDDGVGINLTSVLREEAVRHELQIYSSVLVGVSGIVPGA